MLEAGVNRATAREIKLHTKVVDSARSKGRNVT
jgi:hypothetical protein